MAITVAFQGIIHNGSSYAAASGTADFTGAEIIADFTLTLSGNYGTASSHGDPLSFAISLPISLGNQAPTRVEVFEAPVAGTAALGYQYVYQPGPTLAAPTQAGGALCILGTGAGSGQGGTELTQGSAYSGFTPSLNGVVLRCRAWFARE